jgi:hypothetical protein
MKKLITFILLFCNVIAAIGQIIRGTILDKETGNKPTASTQGFIRHKKYLYYVILLLK